MKAKRVLTGTATIRPAKADERRYAVKVVDEFHVATGEACCMALVTVAVGRALPVVVDELGPFPNPRTAMAAAFLHIEMREAKAHA